MFRRQEGLVLPSIAGEMKPDIENAQMENDTEQLSDLKPKSDDNPYEDLIKLGGGQPAGIQSIYSRHRTTRNAQQREKFLAPDYKGLAIDQVLLRLENPEIEPGFRDSRNCLVFWARPPEHVIQLASYLQRWLKKAAPGMYTPSCPHSELLQQCRPANRWTCPCLDLWLMPSHRMHMTTLEVTHSRTPDEISNLVSGIRPAIPIITNLTYTRRCRLVKPMLSYDLSALALSFLPAAGEIILAPTQLPPGQQQQQHGECATTANGDEYTYHHLRRDVFYLLRQAGVEVDSRYVLPSAHITIGRYLTETDHDTREKRETWVRTIEEINKWLETEVWDTERGSYVGEWMVGQERGLDARSGTLWYGGGRTLMVGEGF